MFIGKDFSDSAMLKKVELLQRVFLNIKMLVIAVIVIPATVFGIFALWGPGGLLIR